MRRLIALILVLFVAVPASAQETRCWIKGAGHHRRYVCATGDGVPGPVAKTWFKAHCRSINPETEADASAAWCDSDVVPVVGPEPIARPPGFWHRVMVGAEVGAAMGLVFILIANGGGGAFQ